MIAGLSWMKGVVPENLTARELRPDGVRRDAWLFSGVAFVVFLLAIVPIAAFPTALSPIWLTALSMHALLALGLALWLAEHLCALVWSPRHAPMFDQAWPVARIAVVMTVCDDAAAQPLNHFLNLQRFGYDLFLLDDSSRPLSIPADRQGACQVLRRGTRAGAKGGNLNFWLDRHGAGYDFVCILDADSVMPPEALSDLGRAAAHPVNRDVAVFQTKLKEDPGHLPTLQARLTGIAVRSRAIIVERVHTRLALLLSEGHNQLVRLYALRKVGGFNVTLCNEDTVLELELYAAGWRSALVDTWSYDREPATFAAYARRSLRWSRQTAEMFRLPWTGVPLRLKLLVCRWLFGWLLPSSALALLVLALWSGPVDLVATATLCGAAWTFLPGLQILGVAFWSGTLVVGSVVAIEFLVFRRTGGAFGSYLLGLIYRSGTNLCMALPIAVHIGMSLVGGRVVFVPTNSRGSEAKKGLSALLLTLWIAGGASFALLGLGAWLHPGSLVIGLNGLWTLLYLASPSLFLISWLREKRRGAGGLM